MPLKSLIAHLKGSFKTYKEFSLTLLIIVVYTRSYFLYSCVIFPSKKFYDVIFPYGYTCFLMDIPDDDKTGKDRIL